MYEGQLLAQIRSEALQAVQQAAEIDLERRKTRVRNLESLLSAARLKLPERPPMRAASGTTTSERRKLINDTRCCWKKGPPRG